MSAPNDFSRRILLAACGMTPQVVTETLYALRVAATEPFAVNEVRLITTSRGRDQAELSLLRNRQFQDFCADYGIHDIRFEPSSIAVIRDPDGRELDDIRTPLDNAWAADCIAEEVRRLTESADTAVHVSLAGGRKTMGYYIGYVLSFYGRPQDRLSHVLVSEGFETHRDFFYPTPQSRVISTADNRYLDTSKAEVTLAEIPFVRLRHALPARLLSERTSFGEAVRWSNLDTVPRLLAFDLGRGVVTASGQPVMLERKEVAFYAAFARAAMDGEPDFEVGDGHNAQLARAYAEELARVSGVEPDAGAGFMALLEVLDDSRVDARTLRSVSSGIKRGYVMPLVSNIKSALDEALGARVANDYRIRPRGSVRSERSKSTLYGMDLAPGQIAFV